MRLDRRVEQLGLDRLECLKSAGFVRPDSRPCPRFERAGAEGRKPTFVLSVSDGGGRRKLQFR
jgi:hypothetical protein